MKAELFFIGQRVSQKNGIAVTNGDQAAMRTRNAPSFRKSVEICTKAIHLKWPAAELIGATAG
ncbi:hypothetical protein D3871_22845 [Noviherbaspirillum saxi]|uniref:Uncharacterized protein n=1 Tax=Noviherbaspirillum saxi TaxID=2320863 RepID=A0A3A3G417_9BURK|nr:hypothetical protein D3871_22845 [Noviherbaspirillum saxi]